MTASEIHEIFWAEHRRDKKLTLINFALIGFAIICFLGLMLVLLGGKIIPLFDDFFITGSTPVYLKIMLPLMFLLTWIIWPWMKLRKINKRPALIESAMAHMRAGTHAEFVQQETTHKIIISLGRITVHLFPVETLNFTYGTETYALPAPLRHIPEIKQWLSGANTEKITAVWNELHTDNPAPETTATTPLKPMSEFVRFADSVLKKPLENMEKGRKKSTGIYFIALALVVSGMGGFIWYNYSFAVRQSRAFSQNTGAENAEMGNHTYSILFTFLGLMVLSYVYYLYMRRKAKGVVLDSGQGDFTQFKQYIFKQMVTFTNPTFEYVQHGHIGLPELLETGLFAKKQYDINGNDLIVGKHSGVAFHCCDLSVQRQKTFSNQNEGPDEVFQGQYFVARFPKSFAAPVYLTAKTGIKDALFTGNDIKGYLHLPAGKVVLEDPEFMNLFDVHCDDQLAARYVLTPALMQRIKEMAIRHKSNRLYIVFKDRKITVANNHRQNKFETGMFTKLTPQLLSGFYGDLCTQFGIIDDLKLNINIWHR